MKPIALVTGATSGIGRATAVKLADLGYRLIITGRRRDRLEETQKVLEMKTDVLPLVFDIQKREEVEANLGYLPKDWADVDVLVNNAGLAAGLGAIQEGDIDDWERMIDTNVKGLLYVSRTITPGMCARKRGHVINIGSIAGRQVYPNGNVYCATKHAVAAISKGMRLDMLPHGVKVTEVSPGAVNTEFSLVRFHGDEARAKSVYDGYVPLLASDIAECIAAALTLPKNICINEMLMMPCAQADGEHFAKK